MTTSTAGAISVLVEADTASFDSSMSKVAANAEREMRRVERSQEMAKKEGARFISVIQRQVDAFGLSGTALLAYEARVKGVASEAQPLIDKLAKLRAEQDALNESVRKTGSSEGIRTAAHEMEGFSFATAGAKRELLVLGHELSQGNYKRFAGSLLVLGERTGAAALLFSAMGVASLAAAGAVAVFVAEVIAGIIEQEKFNRSLILTGNAAGQTNDSIAEMAKTLSEATNTTVGAARGVAEALTATGEIGPRLIGPLTEAILRVQRLSGESTEKMVADYTKIAEEPAKWAREHAKAGNDINVIQYEIIRGLEETGKKEEAALVAIKAVTDHYTSEHVPVVKEWVQLLERSRQQMSSVVDWMRSIGREETMQSRLQKINEELDYMQARGNQDPDRMKSDLLERTAILYEEAGKKQQAYYRAEDAQIQKSGLAASDYLKALDGKARGVDKLKIALDALTTAEANEVKAQRNAGNRDFAINPADHAKRVRELERENKPRGLGHIGSAVEEDVTLESLKKSIAIEDAIYASRNKSLEAYFHAGMMEEATYYADRETVQADFLQKTKAGYEAETALLQKRVDGAKTNDQRVKFQKELVAAQEQYNKALATIAETGALDFINRIGKANKEAAAEAKKHETALAELKKRLDDNQIGTDIEIEKLKEETMLLGLNTLQRKILIEQLKIEKERRRELADPKNAGQEDAINAAADKRLADITGALTQTDAEVKNFGYGARKVFAQYGEDAANAARFSETFVGGSITRLEDAIVNFTKTGKLNFSTLFQFMADEFIRQQARMLIATQTNGTSGFLGGLVQAAASYFGAGSTGLSTSQYSTSGFSTGTNPNYGNEGGFHLAAGTNLVPYDGFRAVLHKDEAVIPKAFNPAAGGTASGSRPVTLNVINNGAPVQAQQSQQDTNQGTVINLVLDAVSHDIQSGGKTHDAIQRRFQLNPGGSTPRY